MRILFDCQQLSEQMTGIGHYADRVLRAMLEIDESNEWVLLSHADNAEHVRKTALGHSRVSAVVLEEATYWDYKVHRVMLSKLVPDIDADVYFSPSFLSAPKGVCPTVSVVHDATYVLYPEFLPKGVAEYLHHCVADTCHNATQVIAVSENSKRDISRVYHRSLARIAAIPLAADEMFFAPCGPQDIAEVRERYGLPEQYILAVNMGNPKKNISTLLKAYSRASSRVRSSSGLVIVGEWSPAVLDIPKLVRSLHVEEQTVLTGYVSQEELSCLYAGALLFCFPSLHEGFGLPVLEAMASGTPVVSSNVASLPEVAGDAAVLILPTDVEAWSAAIEHLVASPEARADLTRKGKNHAATFNWARTAKATLDTITRTQEHAEARSSAPPPLSFNSDEETGKRRGPLLDSRSRPAQRPTSAVSVCTIMYNEPTLMQHWLDYYYDWAHELIVVYGRVEGYPECPDDPTQEILATYPDTEKKITVVRRSVWPHKMAMQNAYMDMASQPVIFCPDCDEFIDDPERLAEVFRRTDIPAAKLRLQTYYRDASRLIVGGRFNLQPMRAFRNIEGFRFRRHLSELRNEKEERLSPGTVPLVDVVLHHYGYAKPLGEMRAKHVYYHGRGDAAHQVPSDFEDDFPEDLGEDVQIVPLAAVDHAEPRPRALVEELASQVAETARGPVIAGPATAPALHRERPRAPDDAADVRKIVVGTTEGIGNTIMLTPALRALGRLFPNAEIHAIGHQPALEVLTGLAHVTRQVDRREMLDARYDLLLVTCWPGGLKEFLQGVVFSRPPVVADPLRHDVHESEQHMQLIRRLGYDGPTPEPYCGSSPYPLSPSNGPRIGLADTSLPRPEWDRKRWPYYRELAKELLAAGCCVYALGDANDAKRYEHEPWPEGVTNLQGELGLLETAGAIRELDVLVANDSGPAHMAAALGTPTLCLWGPTSPKKNVPLGADVEVVSLGLSCAPCQGTTRWATCKESTCLHGMSADKVVRRLGRLVASASGLVEAPPEGDAKRVLFLAVFDARSTNVSQAEALARVGCEVQRYDYRARARQLGSSGRDAEVIRICRETKPDLVLFSKCNGVPAEAVQACREVATTGLWYMDPLNKNFDRELIEKIKLCDFTCCALIEPFRAARKIGTNVHFVHEGFGELVDRPVERPYVHDVSFIGKLRSARRQEYHREIGFHVYTQAFGRNHAVAVAESRTNLNFTDGGTSDRTYKVLAAGGFLLTEPWPEMEKDFKPGRDLDTFTDAIELKNKIEHYLANESARATIAENGHKTVQKFSRTEWARGVLEAYELVASARRTE